MSNLKSKQTVPKHIGIIMDGNGRWAKKRMLPRVAGHKRGVETIRKIAIHANRIGVKLITLYAFSTENWARPVDEVNFLMKLPKDFFQSFLPELIANNCRVDCIGDVTKLPQETQAIIRQAIDESANCSGMVLNFAINYGGQQEILKATKEIASLVKDGLLNAEQIDETIFSNHLYTAPFGEIANPELIIRTSGEQRLSNFLPWQAAYSEFYFTNVLWPDFSTEDFDRAIESYLNRERRFGKV